jgi:hypothetical protein
MPRFGNPTGCSHHTVARYVAEREQGRAVPAAPARRAGVIDEFLPKLEELVERSKGKIRADVAHGKITALHTPSRARVCSSASAAHSAIAVKERAPASTVHTAGPKITASRWRTPRRCRGSAALASTASRPGGSSTAASARSATWPRT